MVSGQAKDSKSLFSNMFIQSTYKALNMLFKMHSFKALNMHFKMHSFTFLGLTLHNI